MPIEFGQGVGEGILSLCASKSSNNALQGTGEMSRAERIEGEADIKACGLKTREILGLYKENIYIPETLRVN